MNYVLTSNAEKKKVFIDQFYNHVIIIGHTVYSSKFPLIAFLMMCLAEKSPWTFIKKVGNFAIVDYKIHTLQNTSVKFLPRLNKK